MRHALRLASCVLLISICWALPARSADTVRVQLKWLHQFQFAGYYAALEKGYYREAGLDVKLIEGAPGVDPAKVVLDGGAEYGVGTPELLLARAAGKPIVVLGVIFQHSPYILLSLKDHGIDSVADLPGKKMMLEPQASELYAYLHRENVPLASLEVVSHSFSTTDLLTGKVDVISAYSTDEPFALETTKTPYLTFTPRAGGVDFYGDCFFTTENEVLSHATRTAAFRDATLKGWDYALKHPDEIIDLILSKYHSKKSRAALAFEAEEMRTLIHPEIIPVGYMYAGRWQHIMETYEELGMLKGPVDLSHFLYDPNPRPDLAPLYWTTAGALLVALITWGILLPIWRLNGRLKREIAERAEAMDMLKAARDAALHASQVKMEFLTHISHDLRTPLSSILMQAEMMSVDPRLGVQTREELGVIQEAGEHLLVLVNDLLDMNRLEAGHIELADVPFRLADVLAPVVDVLGVAAKRKGIGLIQSISPSLDGRLQGDPDRLRQILFNVVGNAVKFTDRGRVAIHASRTPDDWLRLEIIDTGPGIAPESLATIFEPFTRAASAHTKAREGTGLGLAIVKRLTETMGGKVSVSSAPGTGSNFIIQLPIIKASPAPPNASS